MTFLVLQFQIRNCRTWLNINFVFHDYLRSEAYNTKISLNRFLFTIEKVAFLYVNKTRLLNVIIIIFVL